MDDGAPFYSGGGDYRVVELYQAFRRRRTHLGEPWGDKMLPICHWGCCYFSYIDCALPESPVMAFSEDNHGHGPWGCAFALHAHSFEEWMQRWLGGEDMWKSFAAEGEPILWSEIVESMKQRET